MHSFKPHIFIQGPLYQQRLDRALSRASNVKSGFWSLKPIAYKAVSEAVSSEAVTTRSFVTFMELFIQDFKRSLREKDKSKRPFQQLRRAQSLELRGINSAHSLPDFWVLSDSSRNTVSAQLLKIVQDFPCTLVETAQGSLSTIRMLKRLPRYLLFFISLFQYHAARPFYYNHISAIRALTAIELARKAKVLFREHRPRGLFLYRDFTELGAALVQAAKMSNVHTFTTQHAIYPRFGESHARAGNIVFENITADYLVSWGEFSSAQLSSYFASENRDTKVVCGFRPTSESEQQFAAPLGKDSNFVFKEIYLSLSGRRLESENQELLELAFYLANQAELTLRVRLHPILSVKNYRALFARSDVKVEIEEASKVPFPSHFDGQLGFSGLTSTYYEHLFFGIPVIFYDSQIKLLEPLPRVLPPVQSKEDLLSQWKSISLMTKEQWFHLANPVCRHVYNRNCKDFSSRGGLVRYVSDIFVTHSNHEIQVHPHQVRINS